ncbi:zinc-ribbon domain-containing protein [Planktothrix agardhii 1029]|uniref:hypothetical protein n=1 Tax=Planktothrix agardhii TaxID=1160 RepID=UPI0005AA6B05|nr:hypothetical protein [Planktothrix agardhii]MCB8766517.1 zinc-ribbon domain-containing protein [Planktothrix agardhii 1809]MCB8780188.1 zinc-ribbon domain-containing protein [Planktothrix agardhii 1031]MCB8784465.1 zinc-ribbon domain-containing protein [Planktothrix agardhii 1808]MCB8784606.1 zinc-ribbon domain-containing protein [Planktothrix agardhii 1808]MCF3568721.1 zinc-ribbon domain-containing protein [Planktothrix agardhii 1807]
MINQCPSCGSKNFRVEDAAPPHNQKLVCSGCDRFIKWLPKPKTIDRHRELKIRLESLKNKVNGWESIFINDLIKNLRLSERDGKIFKLSPRQLETLEKIEGKSLTVNPQNLDIKGGAR